MRVPLSGNNDEALDVKATDIRELISGEDFDGEGVVFHCRGIIITNSHATETSSIEIWDSDEDDGGTPTGQIMTLLCPPKATTVFDFPAPGITFKTNITASLVDGTVATVSAGALGYKE